MTIKISVVNRIWLRIKITLHAHLQISPQSEKYCARHAYVIFMTQSYDVSLL